MSQPRVESAAVRGVRWSAVSVIGRQIATIVTAIVIARIIGPDSYGVISAAAIYVTITVLLLDQGLAAAIVQRPELTRRAPGAVATINIAFGIILGALTLIFAPAIAAFFSAPTLTGILRILGAMLVLKALAIVPRAMLARVLDFKPIAIVDVIAALAGAVAGIAAALAGAESYSVVFQVGVTDAIAAVGLLIAARGPLPNFALRQAQPLLGFSIRIFATNCIAYFSRNIDNILVGRFLGVTALAFYGMAYRVLSAPVQLVGQTVNSVLFPVFSRSAGDRAVVASRFRTAMETLAFLVIPLMTFVACAAPELVDVVLGAQWAGAAALITVFAIGGARETVFYISTSLMKGLGKARLILWYEVLATALQVTGIVVGLGYGELGVAIGYTAAGFLLTPVLLFIQSRLARVRIRSQLGLLLPPIHASLWGVAAWVLVWWAGWPDLVTLAVGFVAYALIVAGVLLLVHRRALKRFAARAGEVLGRRRRSPVPSEAMG